MQQRKYQLGPIPNFKSPADLPRFYVARKTPNTYVGICPEGSFSYVNTLKDAQLRAKSVVEDGCPWSVDMIVEVLDRGDGMGILEHSWRYHPAFIDSDPVEPTMNYPDAGSW